MVKHKQEIAVLLHNVRSAHNVGAIFRTASAAGVSQLYLCGYTPLPIDRFGRASTGIAKAALGAEELVAWTHYKTLKAAADELKRQHVTLVAVEQALDALDYRAYHLVGPTCFVFGNEVRGLSRAALSYADVVIHIPMQGPKESLNVSVATGIILFHVL